MLQRLHRDQINLNVPACLAQDGRMLGRVADLSLGGFLLAGTGTVPDRGLTELILLLPWPMNGISRVHVTVEQRWQERLAGGRWHAGYRIRSCPAQELVALNRLSEGFSSSSAS